MIAVSDTPDPGFEAILETGLAEYNEAQTHRRDWRALAVTMRDPATGVARIFMRKTLSGQASRAPVTPSRPEREAPSPAGTAD